MSSSLLYIYVIKETIPMEVIQIQGKPAPEMNLGLQLLKGIEVCL